nr:MAG TPA: hypothetical protein [Caudoviricetes sp.]
MKKEYSIIINKQKSILNRQLSIFQHDKGIDIYFKLMDTDYLDLSSNYLLSDIVLVSPLKKQIKSDIVPIIDNKILFTINNEIMNQIDEIGNYHVHIRIYDDKGGRIKLPYFIMSVEECEVDDDDLSYGTVDGTAIDNTKVAKYGKELKTFNDDGSYNRTVWISGDVITDSKLNKLEQATSEIKDEILQHKTKLIELEESKGYTIKKGTEDTPIIISELSKGSYILKGWAKDFNSSTEIIHLDGNRNYAYITSNTDTYTYGLCCFNEDYFKLYRFNKVKSIKEYVPDNLVKITADDEKLTLTGDKYQYLVCNDINVIILPSIDEFAELHLYIRPATDNLVIIFPAIRWKTKPDIIKDTLVEIKLTYIDEMWFGDAHICGDVYISQTSDSTDLDVTYQDYKDIISSTLGKDYVVNE